MESCGRCRKTWKVCRLRNTHQCLNEVCGHCPCLTVSHVAQPSEGVAHQAPRAVNGPRADADLGQLSLQRPELDVLHVLGVDVKQQSVLQTREMRFRSRRREGVVETVGDILREHDGQQIPAASSRRSEEAMTPCFAALHGARANLHGVCTGCVHIVPGTVFMIWAGVYDSPPDPVCRPEVRQVPLFRSKKALNRARKPAKSDLMLEKARPDFSDNICIHFFS